MTSTVHETKVEGQGHNVLLRIAQKHRIYPVDLTR